MKVLDRATGGGTDAAFAQLKARGPVIEGFGLSGFGAHSNDAEYVDTQTIVPRLLPDGQDDHGYFGGQGAVVVGLAEVRILV